MTLPTQHSRRCAARLLLLAAAIFGPCSHADTFKPTPPVPVNAPEAKSVPLYHNTLSRNDEQWEQLNNHLIVRNTTHPALYPVQPSSKGNGQPVIVVPGGGYLILSMHHEGFSVAQRLADAGYTAFVLKYRTLPTRVAPSDFFTEAMKLFYKLGQDRLTENALAVDDLAAAIDQLKALCPKYGCQGDRVHVIGFSAGAQTIHRLLERNTHQNHIASAALMYPPMIDPIGTEPGTTPLFMAIAQDDPLFKQGGLMMPSRWIAQGGSLEFHLYHSGNHGFGLRGNSPTSETWSTSYLAWLKENPAP